jgi:hypothetical protein
MQRSDSWKCVHVEGRTLLRLRTLGGWWWYRCLFFDDGRHHQLISLTRELASPRVSLPSSAKYEPVLLSIKEPVGVRKRPQEFQKLGTPVVESRANFGDHAYHLIAVCGGVILQSLHLAFQVIFLFSRRDTCILSNACGALGERITNDNRSRLSLIGIQSPCLPPTVRSLVGDTNLPRIDAQFHRDTPPQKE